MADQPFFGSEGIQMRIKFNVHCRIVQKFTVLSIDTLRWLTQMNHAEFPHVLVWASQGIPSQALKLAVNTNHLKFSKDTRFPFDVLFTVVNSMFN